MRNFYQIWEAIVESQIAQKHADNFIKDEAENAKDNNTLGSAFL